MNLSYLPHYKPCIPSPALDLYMFFGSKQRDIYSLQQMKPVSFHKLSDIDKKRIELQVAGLQAAESSERDKTTFVMIYWLIKILPKCLMYLLNALGYHKIFSYMKAHLSPARWQKLYRATLFSEETTTTTKNASKSLRCWISIVTLTKIVCSK